GLFSAAPATYQISHLSLHDALPISGDPGDLILAFAFRGALLRGIRLRRHVDCEEHASQVRRDGAGAFHARRAGAPRAGPVPPIAPTRCHHHGWERSMGDLPRAPARGWP